MAGKVPEFDVTVEEFSAYSRRLKQYFVSKDVSDDTKKRAVFLCAIGAKTFGLLEDLIAPASVEDRSYDDLVTVLKEHFEPESSAIVARFRFHTCVRGETESVSVFSGTTPEAGEALSVSSGAARRDAARPAGLWYQTRAAAVSTAE